MRGICGPRLASHPSSAPAGHLLPGGEGRIATAFLDRCVSGGQGVSHYGGQGEPPLRGGCARVPRSKCPQPSVKGTWSETQVDDQGGSVLPAIMAHFLSAVDIAACDPAIALDDDVALLLEWLGHHILSVAGPAYAQRCLLDDFVTAELLARVALCPHRLEPIHRTLQNRRQEFLAEARGRSVLLPEKPRI